MKVRDLVQKAAKAVLANVATIDAIAAQAAGEGFPSLEFADGAGIQADRAYGALLANAGLLADLVIKEPKKSEPESEPE